MTGGRLGILTGAAFLVAWLLLFPAQPWEPDADIYDNLSAARNLLEGEGLSSDVIYPLTTAFEWGRCLPQPMLHRGPGFPFLLTPVLLVAQGDPFQAPAGVRILQLVFLMIVAWLGLREFQRRGMVFAGPAWLLLLLFSPLLGLAVNWGWVEVPCGMLLLALWLRLRDFRSETAGVAQGLVDGGLAGALTLVRSDLSWIPVLWWLAAVVLSSRRGGFRMFPPRGYLVPAVTMWLALVLPWWIHVYQVAGSPFFNPLSFALQLDLDQEWWQYPRLRGLEPQSALSNLRDNFLPALIKVRHGLRFFLETLGQWLPWPVWAGGVALGLSSCWRHRRQGLLRCGGPMVLLGATLLGLVLLYALISQEVRHLIVLLPVVAWEFVQAAAQRVRRLLTGKRLHAPVLTAIAGLSLIIAPQNPRGELNHLEATKSRAGRVFELVEEVQTWPPGPVFTDNAAVCWYSGRTGIWRPFDAEVEATLRRTVPGMRDARWVRLGPE